MQILPAPLLLTGIPAAITAATGLRKLKVEFTVPNPDAAVYYEYTVRDATTQVRLLRDVGWWEVWGHGTPACASRVLFIQAARR